MTLKPSQTRFKNKEEFYKELESLKKKLDSMEPELEVTVRDPKTGVEGYVIVWNTEICRGGPFDRNGRGSGKGGTRILPDLDIQDIRRLAKSMAEKNAAAGLPLGGAKSGLRYDPNAHDYEEKYRAFVKQVQKAGILVEDGGIFGGFGYDVGGKPPFNAQWACDELGTLNSFTGKPVDMGGTDYDKEGMAGLGVSVAAKTMLESRNLQASSSSFAVQGVGAMGSAVIKYFTEFGAYLKSISDPKYGGTWVLANAASLELIAALSHNDVKTANTYLRQEAELISQDCSVSLYQDVDVVFPCALEDTVTKENAHLIKAPFMCEGANNPTTHTAHQILFENGTIIVPDIIANPGGIISAFVELSSSVTAEQNVKTRAKVLEAKELTSERVSANVIQMLEIVDALGVRPDQVADYMAWRNILCGLDPIDRA